MAKRRLPELGPTGRRYLDDTLRARLQGPGIERFASRRRRRGGTAVAIAVLLGVALVAGMAWMAAGR